MKTLNKLLMADTNFISDDWGVQVRWVMCLNHHAVERYLLCRYVLQGTRDSPRKMAYQAQGRVKGTKYKNLTYAAHSRDFDLLEDLGDSR